MTDSRPEPFRDDEISLRVYFETVWRYRQVVGLAVLLVTVVFAIAILVAVVRAPKERTASLQVRLLFEGASRDTYPNGTPFSPTEIIDTPVATAVFAANDLQRFGTYEDFKRGLSVQHASPELYNLSAEYQTKLADYRISPVQRERLEEEFKAKREALDDPVVMISLRRTERFTELPEALAEKVLADTLATWAELATTSKGILRYDVPVLSSRILPRDGVAADDYLQRVDLLRAHADRLLRTIGDLEQLPGARAFRTGGDGPSLPEIRANVEDVVRFELEPLLGTIRTEGVTRNARQLALYASTRAFQLRHDRQELEARASAVLAGLRAYAAGPASQAAAAVAAIPDPKPAEAELDRLERRIAGTLKEDLDFRRSLTTQLIEATQRGSSLDREIAYYDELARGAKGLGARANGPADLVASVTTRTEKAGEFLTKATDQLSAFYADLSARNLGAAARLFVVTRPFADQTDNALAAATVWRLYALLLLLTMLIVPGGCLVHDSLRRRAAAAASTHPPR